MRSVPQPGRPRRFWLILPLILLALMLALFGLIAWASLNGDVPRFDPAAWQAARSERRLYAARYEVLDDLRQQYLRPGTPRQQVLEWLGAPDALDPLVFSSNESVYRLGSSGFFFTEPIFLHVSFDDQDRLLETNVRGR